MGGGDPGMQTPGGPSNPMAGQALSALDQVNPKSPNPTAAMQKSMEALDMAYKLITTVLAQVQQSNPKAAKSAHGIARSILTMKSDLFEDIVPGPTPDLMLGMAGAGAPSAMGTPPPGGAGGGPMGSM
jgi:hypothetical protein